MKADSDPKLREANPAAAAARETYDTVNVPIAKKCELNRSTKGRSLHKEIGQEKKIYGKQDETSS